MHRDKENAAKDKKSLTVFFFLLNCVHMQLVQKKTK